MKKINNLYVWNKGEKAKLSKHFSTNEFSCLCQYPECIEQCVEVELIKRLESLRKDLNVPMGINAGFRCTPYQKHLRDIKANTVVATKSQHEVGAAADVRCGIPIDDFLKAAEKYFTAIGTAKTFLHLDTRGPQKYRWKY